MLEHCGKQRNRNPEKPEKKRNAKIKFFSFLGLTCIFLRSIIKAYFEIYSKRR